METNTKTYAKGDTIFREGDPGDILYILGEGSVELRKKVEGGETVLKVVDKPNEIFGEMAIIDKGSRSATAVAQKDTRLILVDDSVFESMIESNPKFALTIVRVLSARIRASNDRVSELTETDSKERVARSIVDCAIKSGEKIFDGGIKVRVEDLKTWANTKIGVQGSDFDSILFRFMKAGSIRYAATSGETKEHVVIPDVFIREHDRREIPEKH